MGKKRATFLMVRCTGCGFEQPVFSHASTVVKCRACAKTLAIPKGGKAEIKGIILREMS